MQYETTEVRDLRETLECHYQRGRKYVDFIHDLNECTWATVHQELLKAQNMGRREREAGQESHWKTMAQNWKYINHSYLRPVGSSGLSVRTKRRTSRDIQREITPCKKYEALEDALNNMT